MRAQPKFFIRHRKARGTKHTNKISVLEVETVELVTGLLCIHYILIDDESRAFRVVGDPLADLTAWSISKLHAIGGGVTHESLK